MKTANYVDGRSKNKGRKSICDLSNLELSGRLLYLSAFLYKENRPVVAREVMEAARRLKLTS